MKNKAKKLLPILLTAFVLSATALAQLADTKLAPNSEDEKADVDYDLTDRERYESQQFVHEGLLQRQIKEQCENLKDSNACYGNGKTKFMGVDSNLVKGIAKMYSLFGGMVGASGDAMDFSKKSADPNKTDAGADAESSSGQESTAGNEGEGADSTDSEESGKKKNYCVYIPAAGESIAMLMQQLGQQNIQNTPATETPQKDMLYKAARSHETRAKTAKIQGGVWGATTACYGAYMAAGGVALDWKAVLQASAAGFLTIFWLNEAKQQEDYAKEVRKIADNLPGKGDCNPHTQNNCYCAQPETQYDPQFCVPQLQAKALAKSSFAVPCVDKNLQADAKCDCVTKEACFDSEFFSDVSLPGIGQFAQSSAGKNFKKLTRGELVNGKLSAASNGNSAAAKRLLGDLAKKVDKEASLSKDQLGISDALESAGMPGALARVMSTQPTTSAGQRKVASLSPSYGNGANGPSHSKRHYKGNGVLRFSNGLGKIGVNQKKNGPNFKSMLNKYKKKGNQHNKRVLNFAKKAQQAAQIERNKDKPLFEIISRRYQVSGWRRLDIE